MISIKTDLVKINRDFFRANMKLILLEYLIFINEKNNKFYSLSLVTE